MAEQTALYTALTPQAASAALLELGHAVVPESLEVEPRDGRWLVRLPNGFMAWFASSPSGLVTMQRDRRVLHALERCRVSVPRVIAESSDGTVDLRIPVPGVHDGLTIHHRIREDPVAAAHVGRALGEAIAAVHTCVGAVDVAPWLPRVPIWPKSREWARERLPQVVDDRALHAAADAVMAEYEATVDATSEADRAIVHTDLGVHNMSIDVGTLHLHGIFDWANACWADPHLDFKYLVFDNANHAFVDAAIAAYEPATGRSVSRSRIFLYNAALAIDHLAFRVGLPPEEKWGARTLAEDLHWTRYAIARVEASHSLDAQPTD